MRMACMIPHKCRQGCLRKHSKEAVRAHSETSMGRNQQRTTQRNDRGDNTQPDP